MGLFSRKKRNEPETLDEFDSQLALDTPQTDDQDTFDGGDSTLALGEPVNNSTLTETTDNSRVGELESEVEVLRERIEMMTGTNDSLNTKLNHANSRLSVFENNENDQITTLERNLSNANVTISSLQNTLSEMTTKAAKAEGELEKTRDAYENKIHEMNADQGELANKLVAVQAQLDDTIVRNENLARSNMDLRNSSSTDNVALHEQFAVIQVAAQEYVERTYAQYRNTFEDNKQLLAENERLRAGRDLPAIELIDHSSPEYRDLKLKYDKLFTETKRLTKDFDDNLDEDLTQIPNEESNTVLNNETNDTTNNEIDEE